MNKVECPIGATFGDWLVIGEGPPDPRSAHSRWRVKCTTCGGTCVRRCGHVQGAKWGCVGCRNAKFRVNARKNRAMRAAATRRGDSSIALRKVSA